MGNRLPNDVRKLGLQPVNSNRSYMLKLIMYLDNVNLNVFEQTTAARSLSLDEKTMKWMKSSKYTQFDNEECVTSQSHRKTRRYVLLQ